MTDLDTALDVQDVPEEPVTKKPDLVSLYMKRTKPEIDGWEDPNANLKFGPAPYNSPEAADQNISFYGRYATCRADHPLLDTLMAKYPVEFVTTESKTEVWVDAETGKEYKSKRAYNSAQRAKKAAKKG